MNGRVYDYNVGRFLSVDPFIQAPGNSQSVNPYSYIMNNPMAGTDPSGYIGICNSICDQYGKVPWDNNKPPEAQCAYTCVTTNGSSGAQSTTTNPPAPTDIGSQHYTASHTTEQGVNYTVNYTFSSHVSIEGSMENDSNGGHGSAKGAANGVSAYLGQQLSKAGKTRDGYIQKVSELDPSDSDGRAKLKQNTRDKTPKLVRDFIVKNRPSTSPVEGTGGRANSSSKSANKAASLLKHGGRGILAVNLAMNVADISTSENKALTTMRSAFGFVGGLTGGFIGAAGGSVIAPGLGTVVGGVGGAALGGIAGEEVGETVYNFFWGRREDSTSN